MRHEQRIQVQAVVAESKPYHHSNLTLERLPKDLIGKIQVGERNIAVIDRASDEAKGARDQIVRTELRKIIARRKGDVTKWKLMLKEQNEK